MKDGRIERAKDELVEATANVLKAERKLTDARFDLNSAMDRQRKAVEDYVRRTDPEDKPF